MRRIVIPLLAVLMVALLAGCGGGAATPGAVKPASATGAAVQPSATKAVGANQPAATEPSAEEEALDLANREDALKGLKSYRATWSYSWAGKKDGKDQTVKWVTTQEYIAEPSASHIKMEVNDSLEPDPAGGFELIQIGDKSYMISGKEGAQECVSFSGADNSPANNPAGPGSFGSIRGGRYVGQETVNGIRTKHYRYDEKATGVNLFTQLTGDVWVAVEGGYAVKDVAEWEGRFFGATDDSTEQGKGAWTWELSDVNQRFEITAPAGCESGAEGMPIMADASEQASFGDMVTYKTKSKLADVAKFYEAEMPKAGWAAEGEATTTDSFGSLTFTKDGKTANVILSPDGEQVNVMITVQK